MKNKKIIALTIVSTLGLTAYGDETIGLQIDGHITDALNRQSNIAFDLLSANKTVSIPTYLLMDTSDGTLNIPLDEGEDKTRANPKVSMGDIDGWSPTQPFVIELYLPAGVTLTTDTRLLEAAIKIAKIKVSTDKKFSVEDPSTDVLQAGVDYTVLSDGTSLTVLPLNGSLDHGSDYIYAITDTLIDSSGEKLGMSSNYALLKNKQIDQTGTAFELPQKVVWQVEGLMDAYGIADYKNIIYSSWFTTSSAGEALYFTKIATAKALAAITQGRTANTVWQGSANPNNLNLTGLYQLQISNNPATPISANLSYRKGTIKLPSFLERDVIDDKWKKTPWQSGMPSLAIISSVLNGSNEAAKAELSEQLATAGINPGNLTDPTEQLKLVGKSFTIDGRPLDSDRLITKYSPFPQVKAVEDVNFLLITPKKDKNGDTVTALNKVPIVIYQHGITSVKENILLAGNALTKGYAILAIDLPLHGERALSDGTVTTSATADVFMNFAYLPVARDNMRQAVADLIGLRAGITVIGEYQSTLSATHPFSFLDTKNVSFFGHSLGAMIGISLQATIDRPMSSGNDSFAIDKAVFANPGGGVPYLLINSVAFGGTIKHGLMIGSDSLDENSNGYVQFSGLNCNAGQEATCFKNYYDYIETIKPGTQAVINTTFQSFAIAAQTVLETVDPFALARNISAETPVYLAQVKNDIVIPNDLAPGVGYATPYSPIGGTTPLIEQLGLTNIGTDNTGIKKAALLNSGEHSSAIVYNPTYPIGYKDITDELQSQISSFLASNDGKTATIIEPNLLD